jgi:hypothetical protein
MSTKTKNAKQVQVFYSEIENRIVLLKKVAIPVKKTTSQRTYVELSPSLQPTKRKCIIRNNHMSLSSNFGLNYLGSL